MRSKLATLGLALALALLLLVPSAIALRLVADDTQTQPTPVRAGDRKGVGDSEKDSESQRLQGTWKLIGSKFSGNETREGDPQFRAEKWTITKDKIEIETKDYLLEKSVKLSSDGKLKKIELIARGLPTLSCIYRLEDDRMIVATGNAVDSKLPADFSSGKGDTTKHVLIYERVKNEKEKLTDEVKMKRARLRCGASLMRLTAAMHAYVGAHGAFPPSATTDQTGKSLLSWRVALLPYLGEKELYQEFRQDEPWDSDHNRKLLPRMPRIFASVGAAPKVEHGTFFQIFVGEGALFETGKKIGFKDIEDGTSNTLAIVTASEAVPWTKPADLEYSPDKRLPAMAGGMLADGLMSFSLADGSVLVMRNNIDEKVLRALVTRSGGESIDLHKILNDPQNK